MALKSTLFGNQLALFKKCFANNLKNEIGKLIVEKAKLLVKEIDPIYLNPRENNLVIHYWHQSEPGADHLCVFFSSEKINNLGFIIENIKNSSGDLPYRIQSVLRDRLIPLSDINFDPSAIRFDTNSISGGTIVPLVLRVLAE